MVGRVKLCIWIEREARKYKHTVATTSKYAFFAPSPHGLFVTRLGLKVFFCYQLLLSDRRRSRGGM